MSSSFISRVISAFAFCTASSLAPEDKKTHYHLKHFLYVSKHCWLFQNRWKTCWLSPAICQRTLWCSSQTTPARLCSVWRKTLKTDGHKLHYSEICRIRGFSEEKFYAEICKGFVLLINVISYTFNSPNPHNSIFSLISQWHRYLCAYLDFFFSLPLLQTVSICVCCGSAAGQSSESHLCNPHGSLDKVY